MDPDVLVLDEALAAADPHTEADLLARTVRAARTVVLLTEREGVAAHADRVVVAVPVPRVDLSPS